MHDGVRGDMLLTLWPPVAFLRRCILYIRRSNLQLIFFFACCVNLHFVLLPIPIFNDSKLHWLFTDLNTLASGYLYRILGALLSSTRSWSDGVCCALIYHAMILRIENLIFFVEN
jgi:hypothetical protein